MASYGVRPDTYCDLCGKDIFLVRGDTIETEDVQGDREFIVHKRCLGAAIALAAAVKRLVKGF